MRFETGMTNKGAFQAWLQRYQQRLDGVMQRAAQLETSAVPPKRLEYLQQVQRAA